MKHDGLRPRIVKVDGGMVMNNWFSQFLSDVVNVKVLDLKFKKLQQQAQLLWLGLKLVFINL